MQLERNSLSVAFGRYLKPLLIFVGILWGLELVDLVFFRERLDYYGIRPRTFSGLRGVLFAPLLHGGFGHLTTNTLPLLILGFFTMLRGLRPFIGVTAVVWLVGGLGTWLFGGRNTVHIGASILVFGYLGYLLARAYFERSVRALIIALVVGGLYWSLLFGVLPVQAGVSWQGHLFGFVGGVLAARLGSADAVEEAEQLI